MKFRSYCRSNSIWGKPWASGSPTGVALGKRPPKLGLKTGINRRKKKVVRSFNNLRPFSNFFLSFFEGVESFIRRVVHSWSREVKRRMV